MRILVVGGGGREHTLVWKLKQSPLVEKIYCAPGNAGISEYAQCVPISVEDLRGLVEFAEEQKIDLTIVGPEAPLAEGIVDLFQGRGLKIFGPNKQAAKLEGSKVFAKELMVKYNIPTAEYKTFTNPEEAEQYIKKVGTPIVIKAEGLAAGKGVIVCEEEEEALLAMKKIMIDRAFGDAGNRLIVEECLRGEEASILAFTDGESILPMVSSQDHKPVYDGDRGPNTGGMGAYAPAPLVTPEIAKYVEEEILLPAVKGLKSDGHSYSGIIYAGLMFTEKGPKVLEFNCRFGDPEAQVVIPLLKSDLVPILQAVVEGKLSQVKAEWHEGYAVCVVMASGGYPDSYQKGMVIEGLEEQKANHNLMVFHAGTDIQKEKVVTSGGRVLGVTGWAQTLPQTLKNVYEAVESIRFEGAHYRKDIGQKALKLLK
ncbi:phosphoribosylamine--glycine ligase [Candidatus Contubernalis alkaliaceticus]|uniref:phosphoribosylamine--glycine ligase n=1 Tax=Candidatus Contubernalis alkaliaceticus TaxID=338645 RepID=UPI001F4BFAC6|nr:phosphoribosylamine--glycine ligase [Candidatus Contubernalis alkalaceticus]UNC91517.1 phosphoribosylamine--glycine ligase [Candidatus Contubernalis alkalaceticus]